MKKRNYYMMFCQDAYNSKMKLIVDQKAAKQLYRDIHTASYSAHATTRVIHPKSNTPWEADDEILMVKTIKKLKIDIKSDEALAPVSLLIGRAPSAIRIRYASFKRAVVLSSKRALLAKITKGSTKGKS